MGSNNPSIGRIVHYVEAGIHYPAIVSYVWSDFMVNLTVFPNGVTPLKSISQNSVAWHPAGSGIPDQDHSWHWPEYVD